MKKHNKIIMLARSKLNSIESKISEPLINYVFVMKTLWLFLMKKRNTECWKKALEWWTVKEVVLKRVSLIEEGKK